VKKKAKKKKQYLPSFGSGLSSAHWQNIAKRVSTGKQRRHAHINNY